VRLWSSRPRSAPKRRPPPVNEGQRSVVGPARQLHLDPLGHPAVLPAAAAPDCRRGGAARSGARCHRAGDARIEKIAEGFTFGEGPVWDATTGALLFSDPNENVIYRWTEDDGVAVFRANSGYTGFDIGEYGQPGSNGLTFDHEGRLIVAEHGNHCVSRLEKNGVLTVLADRH
jgi:SMP-30/Gluconolactonase/LRE-like region